MKCIDLCDIRTAPWLKHFADNVFKLRIFPEVSDGDITYVIRAFHTALATSVDLIGIIQKYSEYRTILKIAFVFKNTAVFKDASNHCSMPGTHVKRNNALAVT